MTTMAQEDGYVECTECGHEVERHDTTGCHAVDGCTCPSRWTVKAIMALRRAEGLPGEWRRRGPASHGFGQS